jgi:ATP-binding cassette, subfamily B, bacterial
LTAGDVTMVIVLAGQVEGLLGNLVGGAQFLIGALQAATRMRWLESYDLASREHRPPGDLHAPRQLITGIRLEHLTFRYPGTNQLVLDDVSATLPAGSVIAIVGENGAGKTSLIKLLLGLYQPTAGRIVIDDTNLTRIDISSWRASCSAAFQDYCRLEFLIHQAIGVGEPDRMDDRPTLCRAVQAAGAADVIDALPDQLDTQLGATWDHGIDLSGGQWQRVALARSRMRDSPLLLVLDEPTSALDAQTEHGLFERFAAATQDSRSAGSITVLVTHRFSTVRMADLILVLDGARITGRGTHDQLVAAGGLYADLYQLQARAYR